MAFRDKIATRAAMMLKRYANLLPYWKNTRLAVDPKQCVANVSAIRLQESSTILRTGANCVTDTIMRQGHLFVIFHSIKTMAFTCRMTEDFKILR